MKIYIKKTQYANVVTFDRVLSRANWAVRRSTVAHDISVIILCVPKSNLGIITHITLLYRHCPCCIRKAVEVICIYFFTASLQPHIIHIIIFSLHFTGPHPLTPIIERQIVQTYYIVVVVWVISFVILLFQILISTAHTIFFISTQYSCVLVTRQEISGGMGLQTLKASARTLWRLKHPNAVVAVGYKKKTNSQLSKIRMGGNNSGASRHTCV